MDCGGRGRNGIKSQLCLLFIGESQASHVTSESLGFSSQKIPSLICYYKEVKASQMARIKSVLQPTGGRVSVLCLENVASIFPIITFESEPCILPQASARRVCCLVDTNKEKRHGPVCSWHTNLLLCSYSFLTRAVRRSCLLRASSIFKVNTKQG